MLGRGSNTGRKGVQGAAGALFMRQRGSLECAPRVAAATRRTTELGLDQSLARAREGEGPGGRAPPFGDSEREEREDGRGRASRAKKRKLGRGFGPCGKMKKRKGEWEMGWAKSNEGKKKNPLIMNKQFNSNLNFKN